MESIERTGLRSVRNENAWQARLQIIEDGKPTDQLPEDVSFLNKFGIGIPTLVRATERAAKTGVSACEALVAMGAISQEDYARCIAEEVGLEFGGHTQELEDQLSLIPPRHEIERMSYMVPARQSAPNGWVRRQFTPRKVHLAADSRWIPVLRKMHGVSPELMARFCISTRRSNREAIQRRCSGALLDRATNDLRERFPNFSARRVITAPQAVVLLAVLQLIAIIAWFSTATVALTAHLIATAFYLGCMGLRFAAAMTFRPGLYAGINQRMDMVRSIDGPREDEFPVYSVLVALYREAGQVENLIAALLRLRWPVEKLDIRLVCEMDDEETITIIETILGENDWPHINLVRVPPGKPRTKPKALNYALPFCRGDLIVIYDAEDRPHPAQLHEAFSTFSAGPETLVCLQAPLSIHNHHEHWLAKLFAIEYSALFDGLLPMLARWNVPLPLGGTSNHFKRNVLEAIGAWDPYNVTEDADLGLRIARAGLRTGTITLPTFEEAPVDLDVWLKQRTRWFKGWFQTWLVHMRQPLVTTRDLGLRGAFAFHLTITGMIVSVLVHPFILWFAASWSVRYAMSEDDMVVFDSLLLLDMATVFAGYVSLACLAWRTLALRNMKKLRWWLLLLPVYWVLLSAAGWRAFWHLIRRPHEWEKTPHRLKTRIRVRESASTI